MKVLYKNMHWTIHLTGVFTCHRMKSYYTTLQRVVGMSSCSVLYGSEVDVMQRQWTKNGF